MKKQDDPKEPLPNDPRKKIPVKPDKNPDPTKKKPGVHEPEKVDPTRIEEPEKNDPTRIPDPNKEEDENEEETGEPTDAALFYTLSFF
jgi:hypothetical protein